ncbi:MAG: hypothetical protein NZ899_01080 [Thermoguttaceae bacterium]|nr:hypothetical protein [Thermoguttaceae bacterium]MDW8077487.1 hypothetical protein [Thermoguttaceae bacterium]
MTSSNRTARFAQVYEILQRHYQPVLPDPNRSIFELLIFGCCLEDAPFQRAEDSFARLQQDFFDWNEVRVSTVRELSEVFCDLPEPTEAASRVKRVLQSIFEASYSFELDSLRRQTLSQAEESLKKIDGTTPFTIAYVLQSALGGHVIPLDRSTLEVLRLLDLATPEEISQGQISGLYRAVPKTKGIEFASLLHQLGAAYKVNPFAPSVRQILLEIEPGCRDRLPCRRSFVAVTQAGDGQQQQAAGAEVPQKRGRGRQRAEAQGATTQSPPANQPPASRASEQKSNKRQTKKRRTGEEST